MKELAIMSDSGSTTHYCAEMIVAAQAHDSLFSIGVQSKYLCTWSPSRGLWELSDGQHIVLSAVKHCPFCDYKLDPVIRPPTPTWLVGDRVWVGRYFSEDESIYWEKEYAGNITELKDGRAIVADDQGKVIIHTNRKGEVINSFALDNLRVPGITE